jgi:DNA modification methylase
MHAPLNLEDQLVDRFNAAWRSSVLGIVEAGRVLREARDKLPRGRFVGWVESRLHRTRRTADMLIAIADDSRIEKYISQMPTSWGTLYDISQLSGDDFDRLLGNGTICAEMQRRDLDPDGDDDAGNTGTLTDQQRDQILALQQNYKWGAEAIAQALKLPVEDVRRFLDGDDDDDDGGDEDDGDGRPDPKPKPDPKPDPKPAPEPTRVDVQLAGEPFYTILQGDVRDLIADLPEVHCVITSPPYYDKSFVYGDSDREIGHEANVDAYIATLVDVFKAIPLHPAGSIWVNISDTRRDGRLLNVPARFSLAMQAAGFHLIDVVIWAKSVVRDDGTTIGNFMTEPVLDRLNEKAHEVIYRFTKGNDAWTDLVAIQIPRFNAEPQRYLPGDLMTAMSSLNGRNAPNVWLMRPGQTRDPHYGTFPAVLVERPCVMTCPPFVNPDGTLPRRLVERIKYDEGKGEGRVTGKHNPDATRARKTRNDAGRTYTPTMPLHMGWEEIAADATPGIVCDPFCGVGTTGEVALKLGRSFVGIDLYDEYVTIARMRCAEAKDHVRRTYGYAGVYERILNPPAPVQDDGGEDNVIQLDEERIRALTAKLRARNDRLEAAVAVLRRGRG